MTQPKVLLVRTAATELDLQGRICGRLDVPLSPSGISQSMKTAAALRWHPIDVIYRAPCQAAAQTAEHLADATRARVKIDPDLINIDFGLWHGKRIEDLKKTMPTAYRCWAEQPEKLVPPEGESIVDAIQRVARLWDRLLKKHSGGCVAIVVSPPIFVILKSLIEAKEIDCRWCRVPADAGWAYANEESAVLQSVSIETPG